MYSTQGQIQCNYIGFIQNVNGQKKNFCLKN